MRKSKNRMYRWIAAMLTAALLVGQCQMPVLANEGSAPTEADISDENKAGTQEGEAGVTDKDAPKESNTDQGGEEDGTGEGGSGETSSGNGSTDGTGEGDNGADNGGTDGAGEGDNGMDNGGTDDAGENVPGADDAGIGDEGADQGGEEGAPDKCVCGTACTEDAVNMDCPVCAADYAACAKNAGGGVKPSEGIGEEDTVSENDLEGEEDIALMAMDDGAEPLAVGDTFWDDGSHLWYRVTGDGEVEVKGEDPDRYKQVANVIIPESIVKDGVTWRVTGIGVNAFRKSDTLRTVSIPASVERIGDSAFASTYLSSATIAEGVTEIGNRAFYYCSLKSITIPKSVRSIGEEAFYSNEGLKSVTIPEGVTSIEMRTFADCSSLTKVEIPGSVTSIGDSAFAYCSSLASVTIPASVTVIEECAFADSGLTSVEIPQGVTRIERAVFESCKKLTRVTIPEGVTSIGKNAFFQCESLLAIEIPQNVTMIGEAAFHKCKKLTRVTIPEGVTRIEQYTFSSCTGLNHMEIPQAVINIGKEAFKDCENLKELRIAVSSGQEYQFPKVGADAFTNIPAPVDRKEIRFVNDSDEEVIRQDFLDAFAEAAQNDNDGDDSRWYGWSYKREGKDSYTVTIDVKKDGTPWGGHGRTFALRDDNAAAFTTDFNAVEQGTYEIYDVTGVSSVDEYGAKGMNTGVTVSVVDAPASATVDYYTVSFYDIDIGGNEVKYGHVTVLKTVGRVVRPADPEKGGYDFEKWVTAPNGDEEFNFASAEITAPTKIYAKWKVNAAPTYAVTINVKKDGNPWNGHGRTFALSKDSGTAFVTDLDTVEAGTYDIYDVTGLTEDEYGTKGVNTGETLAVSGPGAEATVEYYTVTFYEEDEKPCGETTDWKPQTVLKTVGRVTRPMTDPAKQGYTFDKWVKEDQTTEFVFRTAEITAETRIYAAWTKNTEPTYKVTIQVKKDGEDWAGHNRTFALRTDSGTKLIADLTQVPDGTYNIYDMTGINPDSYWSKAVDTGRDVKAGGVDTNVEVTVQGAAAEATVHYYTVTFYDGDTAYPADTPQAQQIVLSGHRAEPPAAPAKNGYRFTGWKIRDGGTTDFDFNGTVNGKTSVYAGWEAVPMAETVTITATAGTGGTISPSGTVSVNKGGSQAFQITADTGYHTKSVTVDDQDVTAAVIGAKGVYTFTDVNENHTIAAVFEADARKPSGSKPGGDKKPDDRKSKENNSPGGSVREIRTVSVVQEAAPQNGTVRPASAPAPEETASEREPQTADPTPVEVYATAAMIAGLTYLLLYFMEEGRGMSEREKEVFVAAFIRWAKKGGRFRKCCAVAAIFCILVYYHSIGKRAHGKNFNREYLRQAL